MRRLILLVLTLAAAPAAAAEPGISLQDSFRLGSGGSVICSAESASRDPALRDMFDRAYAIVCRDAAAPVGRLYALRVRREDPEARLAALRQGKTQCAPAARTDLEGLRQVAVLSCTLGEGLPYRVYNWRRAARSTCRGLAAMTARFASASGLWPPTGRCREMSRWR